MIDAAFHQDLHQLYVAGVNLGLVLEGDVFGLFVGAFAEPYADALGEQLLDVGFGAPHIRLDHRPYASLIPWNPVEFVNKVGRALRIWRSFHIDANKILGRHAGRLRDQPADNFVGHCFVQVEAHVGQLQADICVQLVGGDFVEQVVIKLGAGTGLVGVGDVLSQIVDGDAGSELIDSGGG